jgi:hypothetical protein
MCIVLISTVAGINWSIMATRRNQACIIWRQMNQQPTNISLHHIKRNKSKLASYINVHSGWNAKQLQVCASPSLLQHDIRFPVKIISNEGHLQMREADISIMYLLQQSRICHSSSWCITNLAQPPHWPGKAQPHGPTLLDVFPFSQLNPEMVLKTLKNSCTYYFSLEKQLLSTLLF